MFSSDKYKTEVQIDLNQIRACLQNVQFRPEAKLKLINTLILCGKKLKPHICLTKKALFFKNRYFVAVIFIIMLLL